MSGHNFTTLREESFSYCPRSAEVVAHTDQVAALLRDVRANVSLGVSLGHLSLAFEQHDHAGLNGEGELVEQVRAYVAARGRTLPRPRYDFREDFSSDR